MQENVPQLRITIKKCEVKQVMAVIWYDFDGKNFDIYGINSNFHRLPEEFAESVSEGVAANAKCPAGGRIRFTTNSENIHIRAVMKGTKGIGFDLFRLENGSEVFTAGFRKPEYFICDGDFETDVCVSRDKEMHSYTLNFPYFGEIEDFKFGIDEGSILEKGEKYKNEKPVAFYGSSITHGAWVTSPGSAYVSMISQKYNLTYLNFGFAGSAKGEMPLIEYIAKLDISAFVSDYDHNAYDIEWLESTHLNMYKTVRKYKPYIPYIIITRPDYWTEPENNDKRNKIMYATYEYAKKNGEDKVYFVDGKTLFGGEYYRNCTKDGCHPNDLGAYRMAQKIGPVVAQAIGINGTVKHDFTE